MTLSNSPVNVCVDGYNLAMPMGTGIATYARNLLDGVTSLGMQSQVLYGPAQVGHDPLLNELAILDTAVHKSSRFQRWKSRRSAWAPRYATGVRHDPAVIWPGGLAPADTLWLARDVFRESIRSYAYTGRVTELTFQQSQSADRPDVVHWTSTLPIRARRAKNIYTIHDLIPLKLPHTTLGDKALYLKLHKALVERADHIAVVSETTRRDVIELLGVSPDKVTNTYQSIKTNAGDRVDESTAASILHDGFALPWKGYFLHFGALEPKKNLGRIVEAYLLSRVQTPLVIVRGRSWLEQEETALLETILQARSTAADRIRVINYLPATTLTQLIRGAKAVVFPSLYEGFGLPALEAMALGSAVLTSSISALPEITGDAAVAVDPYDVSAISRGLQLLDADRQHRENLQRDGRIRAAFFDQARYRGRLADLYGRL